MDISIVSFKFFSFYALLYIALPLYLVKPEFTVLLETNNYDNLKSYYVTLRLKSTTTVFKII